MVAIISAEQAKELQTGVLSHAKDIGSKVVGQMPKELSQEELSPRYRQIAELMAEYPFKDSPTSKNNPIIASLNNLVTDHKTGEIDEGFVGFLKHYLQKVSSLVTGKKLKEQELELMDESMQRALSQKDSPVDFLDYVKDKDYIRGSHEYRRVQEPKEGTRLFIVTPRQMRGGRFFQVTLSAKEINKDPKIISIDGFDTSALRGTDHGSEFMKMIIEEIKKQSI